MIFKANKARRSFQVRFMAQNLMRLQKGGIFCATRQGQIVPGIFCLSKKWLHFCVESTFKVFLQKRRSPLHLLEFRRYAAAKKEIIGKVLRAMENNPFWPYELLDRLKSLQQAYHRHVQMQERLLCNMEKSTRRAYVMKDFQEQSMGLQKPRQGCSGSYFVESPIKIEDPVLRLFSPAQKKMGIFKPFDEEIGGPNNPKGFLLQGVLAKRSKTLGLCTGENVHREVAAYVVSKFLKIACVPKTQYVRLIHKDFYNTSVGEYRDYETEKRGSFQEFVPHAHLLDHPYADEMRAMECDQVHQLLILDLVIGNTDRHCHNVLIGEKKLIAIDNGRSFCDRHVRLDMFYKELFPHMEHPFSHQLQTNLLSLDIAPLAKRLMRTCFLQQEALQRMQERWALLRAGLLQQLAPFEILSLVQPFYANPLKNCSQTSLLSAADLAVKEWSASGKKKEQALKHIHFMKGVLQGRQEDAHFRVFATPDRFSPGLLQQLKLAATPSLLVATNLAGMLILLGLYKQTPLDDIFLLQRCEKGAQFARLVMEALQEFSTPEDFWQFFLKGKGGWRRKKCRSLQADMLAKTFKKHALFTHLPEDSYLQKIKNPQFSIVNRYGKIEPLFFVLQEYAFFHDLARRAKWHITPGECVDKTILQSINARLQALQGSALFYLSDLSDRLSSDCPSLQAKDVTSWENFFHYLTEDVAPALSSLPGDKMFLHSSRKGEYFLRLERGRITWQRQDV